MYSQLWMVREPATNDYKPLGTHRTLGLISIIDEMKPMEGELLKGEHYGNSHNLARGTNKELNNLEEIIQRTCSQTKDHVCILCVPGASEYRKNTL
jgi:hypothetical protein